MQNKTLPNITSLRFFLALLVVLFHISQFGAGRGFPMYDDFSIFQKGAEAVYMFFSLSGFLIIRSLYLEKLVTGNVSLGSFYKRRILRIFPLYYAVLIFGLFYYNYLVPTLGYETEPRQYEIWQGLLLGATFFSNILATFRPGGILEILWSIGIEEQFYLLIAPVILILPVKKIMLFLVAFSAIYFVLYHNNNLDFLRDYKMMFYYFSVSGVVGIISVRYPSIKASRMVRIVFFAIFLLYFVTNIFLVLPSVLYQMFSVVLFACIILCAIQIPNKFLENQSIKYLGKISYSIYMLHTIVLQITGFVFLKIDQDKPIVFFVSFTLSTIILTVILSHLSYKYFESYFLKFKSKAT